MSPHRAAFAVACLLLPAFAVGADDAAEAKAIIEKAIKAQGLKPDSPEMAESWKDAGSLSFGGMKMEYVADWTFQPPAAYRFDMTTKFNGQDMKLAVVMNGKEAWQAANGAPLPIEPKKLDSMKHETYQLWVTSLLPLLREKEFKLSMLPEGQIDGKPAQGVKVVREGHREVSLFFDRETGLLAKMESTVPDEFQGWKEVKDEAFFSDYKDVGGLKRFCKMKIVRDGKPLLETVLSEQKRMEKADPKIFDKP